MRLLRVLGLLLLWGLMPAAAHAQGAVQQQGAVVNGHLARWSGNGRVMDAGGSPGPGLAPINPASPGILPTGAAVLNSGLGYCQFSGPASAPYLSLCWGFDGAGNGLLSLATIGGGTQPGLNVSVNGTLYPFPGPGSGDVLGPTSPPTVVGHVATWNNTGGTLLADDAVVPANQFDLAATTATATLSSLDSRYFPTYSQLTGDRAALALAGAVSDAAGSFRDAFYATLSDSDTAAYTQSHSDYAGRFAAFGPYSAGAWQSGMKNIVALNAYALGANASTALASGVASGVSGINADAFQYGGGIGDNEFAAHNPSAANGGIAQSISLAAVQGIIDQSYADADASHTAYAFLASNTGAHRATAAYGASGSGQYLHFLDAGSAVVTQNGIVMPGSASGDLGTIIDYGTHNGNPAGGSWTDWLHATSGGQYRWIDGNVVIATVDTEGMNLFPLAGFDGYAVTPRSGTGGNAFVALGTWNDGLNLAGINIADAAIVLQATVNGSTIRFDPTNFTALTGSGATGIYNITTGSGAVRLQPKIFTQLQSSGAAGQIAVVTDASTNVWGNAIAGAGGNTVLAWWNGTAWTVLGK